jgi:hypothetical protein
VTDQPEDGPGRMFADVDPASYTTRQLVEWLLRGVDDITAPRKVAAVMLLAQHGRWLDRIDFRAEAVRIWSPQTLVGAAGAAAVIDYSAAAAAIEAGRLPADGAARVVLQVAGLLARGDIDFAQLDVASAGLVLHAVAWASGYDVAGLIAYGDVPGDPPATAVWGGHRPAP